MPTLEEAKKRLDSIIDKARVDLYKPIQIAEVLHHSRLNPHLLNINDKSTYQNSSLKWRDMVTQQLLGKICTSSARFQHDLWNETAMPPDYLQILDQENRQHLGIVEAYIYSRFQQRQGTVNAIIDYLNNIKPNLFSLTYLLAMFIKESGIRRSIDKAYEIITYALFETIISSLETQITIQIPHHKKELLDSFSDITQVLIGLSSTEQTRTEMAHIYRVGVTNAADRGLDMWANFGIAIQVKHLTLDATLAKEIVNQVESDHIVIVCKNNDAEVIRIITQQIGWGQRVRGIVTESQLIEWYTRCFSEQFIEQLGIPLLTQLRDGFLAEFPQTHSIIGFLNQRQYPSLDHYPLWHI